MKKTDKQSFSANKKIYYDKKSDALWLLIKSGLEEEVREVSPGVNVELGKNGEILGIEILNASKILSEFDIKSVTRSSSVSI